MRKLKTIFMGTPEYVIPSLELTYNNSDLLAVFTAPDRKGGRGNNFIILKPKEFAQTYNIPVYQPNSLKDSKIVNILQDLTPDLLIVNAYGFILPKTILEIPKLAPINLHGSLLPKYRGASPIQSALVNGDKETGITVQIMNEKLDEGDIIYQLKTPIDEDDDYISLSNKLSKLSADCVRDVIKLFEEKKINPIVQASGASYCSKIKKEDGIINWADSFEIISNKMKAYINWPQSYCYYEKKKIIIHKISLVNDSKEYNPGTIVQVNKNGIFVQCGSGLINILMLQPEGKKPMNYLSFLNGHKWEINKVLASN
ncbi:MAG: methionyl-tRNA formyltransferase [Spirochaetota bacterium]|nr:methionyl-tRNA formyltransferase [Spirochaetota bacterium]